MYDLIVVRYTRKRKYRLRPWRWGWWEGWRAIDGVSFVSSIMRVAAGLQGGEGCFSTRLNAGGVGYLSTSSVLVLQLITRSMFSATDLDHCMKKIALVVKSR